MSLGENLEEKKLRKSIIKKYGNGPYNLYDEKIFQEQIPLKYTDRKKRNFDETRSEWDSQFLDYNQFKHAEFIDEHGREYKIAKNSLYRNTLINAQTINNKFENINTQVKTDYGTDVLFVRIPKRIKSNLSLPNLNETLHLIHIPTQIQIEAIVDEIYTRKGLKSSGLLKCNHLISQGPPSLEVINRFKQLTNNKTEFYNNQDTSWL